MEIHAIGIDLGKTLFHLVGVDANGSVVVRKRCSRTQLLAYTANVRVRVIGMEACSGSHFLGRALRTNAGRDWSELPVDAFAEKLKQGVHFTKDKLSYASGLATSQGLYLTVRATQEDNNGLKVVFHGHDLQGNWLSAASLDTDLPQYPSYVDSDGNLFVVSTKGLLKQTPGGDWRNISGPIVTFSASNVLIPSGDALLFATSKNVWYSYDKGESWKDLVIDSPYKSRIETRTLTRYGTNMVLFANGQSLYLGMVSVTAEQGSSEVWSADFHIDGEISGATVEIDGSVVTDAFVKSSGDYVSVRGGPTSSNLVEGAHSIVLRARQGTSELNERSYVWKEQAKEWLGFGPYQRSYAVVAAVSNYSGTGLSDLPMAEVQARKVAEALTKQGFEVKLFSSPNATKEAIEGYLLGELRRKVNKGDRVLIYFGGHGYTLTGAQGQAIGYLATQGVKQDSIELGLPMSRIEAEYSQLLGAGQVLFVLDACFSGLASARATSPSEENLRNFQRYSQIKILSESGVRAVLTAGRRGDVALDVNGGIFTTAFLDGIAGSADYDHNGVVTLPELYLYVQTQVQKEAALRGYSQLPQLSELTSFGEGQFLFIYR